MSTAPWMKRVALAGGIGVTLAGCGLSPQAAPSNPVLATVNGHAITLRDWKQTMNGLSALQGSPLPTTAATEKSQVQQLAVWSAVEQWALQHHLTTPAKAGKAAQALVAQYAVSAGGTKAFQHDLAPYHLSVAQFTQFMTSQEILESAFVHVTHALPPPSNAAIVSYYNSNKSLFLQPASDALRIIVVNTAALAQQLEQRLKQGASFAQLAHQYSTDKVSAAKGGNIGTISQSASGGAPSQLLAVMDKLQAGQYGVAQVGGTYYVMQVEKVNPATTAPLSQVKAQIVAQLKTSQDNTVFQAFGQNLLSHDHVVMHVK
jgi:hypothetical protein